MSIGIYAFLRIYFLGFGVSVFAQFRTRHINPPAPCTATIYPARPVWYRVQTGAASGRVYRCAACCGRSALVLAPLWFWYGLRCCLCCVVCPGALGARVSTSGVYGESRGSGGRYLALKKFKKGVLKGCVVSYPPPLSCAKHPTPIAKSSKFPAKTKRPLQRVCVLCYTCLTSLEREESVK